MLQKIIMGIISSVMIYYTLIGFFPDAGRSGFAGGSAESLMNLSYSNLIAQSILLIIGLFLLFKKKKKGYQYILVAITLSFWVMSGRTIGVIAYPNGRISTGWFYTETHRFYVCNEIDDCEKTMYYETSIEKLFLWRVRIKNKNIDQIVFLGPINWYQTIEIFRKNFEISSVNPESSD